SRRPPATYMGRAVGAEGEPRSRFPARRAPRIRDEKIPPCSERPAGERRHRQRRCIAALSRLRIREVQRLILPEVGVEGEVHETVLLARIDARDAANAL